MVARIVVLVLPSQGPDQGIVRSQDSVERSWFKVSRFCYMLMKYPCDRLIAKPKCNFFRIRMAGARGKTLLGPGITFRLSGCQCDTQAVS